MNIGLVLLAAWAQWLAIVGLLVLAVVRRVERVHDHDPTFAYRRGEPAGPAAPADQGDADPAA